MTPEPTTTIPTAQLERLYADLLKKGDNQAASDILAMLQRKRPRLIPPQVRMLISSLDRCGFDKRHADVGMDSYSHEECRELARLIRQMARD